MGEQDPGKAPKVYFQQYVTTAKLTEVLDVCEAMDIEIFTAEFVGGRDWLVITKHVPIPGPAGRRILS